MSYQYIIYRNVRAEIRGTGSRSEVVSLTRNSAVAVSQRGRAMPRVHEMLLSLKVFRSYTVK